jgi:putative DNA methylase
MTRPYKKKLIEIAIPLEAINVAASKEKAIRHGHPSTLHLWWSRKPLAACRAVLFAQLVDDPSSNPEEFSTHEAQEVERKRLFGIIEDLVKWENTTNEEVLERARAEIRKSCGDKLPPVYDPFSGGGSIPLEAQRLGLPAYGSDLNPVAVMIGKAMIEIPTKFSAREPIHPGIKERNHYRHVEGLAEDVRHYGEWIRDRAFERIGHLYPKVDLPKEYGGGDASVIAWIWSRTVPSPDPAFSEIPVPIASNFVLSAKPGQEVWIEPVVDKVAKTIVYRIRNEGTAAELQQAKQGTKAGRGANFRCILSGSAITMDHVRSAAKNGQLGSKLMAIVAEHGSGRIFLEANKTHEHAANQISSDLRPTMLLSPDRRAFTPPDYGMLQYGDLFTERQLVLLNTLSELVHEARKQIENDTIAAGGSNDQVRLSEGGTGARAYAEAVSVYLGFGVSRLSDIQNALCRWEPSKTQVRNLFGRQAIPMLWEFGENNAFANAAGDFRTSLGSIIKVLERLTPMGFSQIVVADAKNASLPNGAVISTDPPYYDNVGYADLSDFFFCWMRPILRPVFPEIFGLIATPKSDELVASSYRHGGRNAAEEFFLDGMRGALSNLAVQSSNEFPATVYYAFKQSEIAAEGISSTGWATFLQAMLDAGYSVVGTWPMRTELANRMRATDSNALANSVILVCRRREATADIISRAEFIRALKRELPAAIAELQAANIAPADMPQSAIGPGMGVFSRYTAVLESDDRPMTVKAALQLINRELDDYLGGIVGEFDADTRFAITWFEQNGMAKGEYGTANNIAQARGISVDSVKHAGIVESAASKVRLLRREELDADWDPATDTHLTIWECCQYLIRALENEGEYAAAVLLKKIGSEKAEAVKDLAYCLYDICSNKRKDAKEATSYNALIAVWTDLTRLAATIHDTRGDGQISMAV